MDSASDLETLICCSICLERFTKPKMLPCQHTFCLTCLMGLKSMDKNGFRCPHCRAAYLVPENGMQGFPDNLFIQSILDIRSEKKQTTKCTDCRTKKANKTCEHCLKDVCAECRGSHLILLMKIQELTSNMEDILSSSVEMREICKKRQIWQSSMEALKQERKQMNSYFIKCMEALERRRKSFEDYFDNLTKLHSWFLHGPGCVSDKVGIAEVFEEWPQMSNAANIEELKNVKKFLISVHEALRLLRNMHTGDYFKFIGTDLLQMCTRFDSLGCMTVTDVRIKISNNQVTSPSMPFEPNWQNGKMRNESNNPISRTNIFRLTDRNLRDNMDSTPSEAQMSAQNGIEVLPILDVFTDSARGRLSERFTDTSQSLLLPTQSAIVPDSHARPLSVKYKEKVDCHVVLIDGVAEGNRLNRPTGVAFCPFTNKIMVADRDNHRIMLYEVDGSGGRPLIDNKGKKIDVRYTTDVAVSKSGKIFIADAGNQRVLSYSKDGKLLTVIGSRGDAQNCFMVMFGIACHDDHLLIVDWHKDRVSIFTEMGKFVRHVGSGVLRQPFYVTTGPDNRIYVADSNDEVSVFEWEGRLIRKFGKLHGSGASGLAVDGQGYVCVSRTQLHRIDVFDPQFQFHSSFGKPGNGPGCLNRPQGLALLPGGRVAVCDWENNRIQLF